MTNFEHIIALDLERACWEKKSPGEIIQIGLAVMDSQTGKIIKTRSDYVTPVKDDISQYCTDLTGISATKLKKAGRPFVNVMESIYAKIGANKLYVTWGDDMSIIKQSCHTHGIDFKLHSVVDLSLLFHFHLHQTGQKLSHKMGLEKAMNYYGLNFDGKKHNAEVDATNTAVLAHHFFKKIGLTPNLTQEKESKPVEENKNIIAPAKITP